MDATKRASLAKAFTKARDSAMRSDTSSFLGAVPPNEVVQMAPLLGSESKVERPVFRKILQFVMEYMKGTAIGDQHWSKLKEATGIAPGDIAITFAGLLTIMRKATRVRVDMEVFKRDCVDVLHLPVEFVADLSTFLTNWRSIQNEVFESKKPRLPGAVQVRWRVDVAIMSNSLNRVMKPCILMEITDSEGNIRTFEMTKEQFHKLRFSTAHLLKELDNVERTPILAIDRVKQ